MPEFLLSKLKRAKPSMRRRLLLYMGALAALLLFSLFADPTEEEIRVGISGNICRCTGYDLIVECIRLAAKKGAALWNR